MYPFPSMEKTRALAPHSHGKKNSGGCLIEPRPLFAFLAISSPQIEFEFCPFSRQIRCRYALRYGEARPETEVDEIRADQIRSAFNSPFRPFVLATTSIGQEGLDFISTVTRYITGISHPIQLT